MKHSTIAKAGEYYEVTVNGMVHTFLTRQAARLYLRQFVQEQKKRMEIEYLRQAKDM